MTLTMMIVYDSDHDDRGYVTANNCMTLTMMIADMLQLYDSDHDDRGYVTTV